MKTSLINLSNVLSYVSCDKNKARRVLRTSALHKFAFYVGHDNLFIDTISKDYIDGFLSWVVKGGSSPKTIELYRDALRCIFVEQFPDFEDQIKRAFKKAPQRRGAQTHGLNVEQLRSLAKAEFGDREDLTQTRDLFLFCVYCGGLDYSAAKLLTKSSLDEKYLTLPTGLKVILSLNIQAAISMYNVENSDMLFPFLNSMIEANYVDNLKEIGERFRLIRLKGHHSEAKAWLTAAKELQIDTEVMAACAYKRVGILTHYSDKISDNRAAIDNAMTNVCRLIMDDTEHWYAMKLRNRVTPDRIEQIICENKQLLVCRQLKTYYPMEDIKVRVGSKWKQDTKAFIKDVLFFRTKKQFVDQLFRIVRNEAWIFRQSNTPMSPYAVISQHDMENFQRAISQFTDDISITIVENSDIKVGKKVRLNSGEFAGCEGIIENEEVDVNIPELRNFYVKFTSNNSFKFQIKVSESSLTILD